MVLDKEKKRLPPYVSYRTFRNFLDGLQVGGMPARIDRSYWGDRLSGTTGTQLISALRFLNLVDASGVPTNRLRMLVAARGPQRNELLRQVTFEAFAPLMKAGLDPQNATYSQLEEIFHDNFNLSGDVSRKCIKFFIMLAGDAGVHLSPFITRRLKSPRAGTNAKKAPARTKRNEVVPNGLEEVPNQVLSWEQLVLSKFPTFDPAWSDELKLKWFESYEELLKRG
ncbi:MAG: DUF5343 domain-containing protein, partial [Chloroflexota bacterium]